MGVIVGVGVLVAVGSDLLLTCGAGVLAADEIGVLVEGGDSGDLPGSSEHPAIMPIRMIDQRTSRAAWFFIWNPLTATGLRSLAKSRPEIRGVNRERGQYVHRYHGYSHRLLMVFKSWRGQSYQRVW